MYEFPFIYTRQKVFVYKRKLFSYINKKYKKFSIHLSIVSSSANTIHSKFFKLLFADISSRSNLKIDRLFSQCPVSVFGMFVLIVGIFLSAKKKKIWKFQLLMNISNKFWNFFIFYFFGISTFNITEKPNVLDIFRPRI